MKIEVRDLMDNKEMLSILFFECVPKEQIVQIKEKYIGTKGNEIDWQKESVKIPITMQIGGFNVNPKKFFDEWQKQMNRMILDKAKELVSEKIGSGKMAELQNRIYDMEQVLKNFETDINWDVENPFNK